jgi:hypothetical protein
LNKSLHSSLLIGFSAGVLSGAWLVHCGGSSISIPFLVGIGTFTYYAYCAGCFPIPLHNKWGWFPLISIGLIGFYTEAFFNINSFKWLILSVLFIILCIYNFPFSGKKTLRTLPYLKPLIVSICWLFFVLILPVWLKGIPKHVLGVEYFLIWLFFLALTIPNDIRDMQTDSPSMKTIPQVMGKRGARIAGITLIGLFGLGNLIWAIHSELFWFSLVGISFFDRCLERTSSQRMYDADVLILGLGVLYFFL